MDDEEALLPPPPTIPPAETDDAIVEHIARLWDSATQNAERIAGRVQLVAGGIVGILSVSFLSFTWFYDDLAHPMMGPVWTIAIHIFLTLSIGCMLFALFRLYYKPNEGERGMAADKLELQPDDGFTPIKTQIAKRLNAAYFDLKERNVNEKARLSRAEDALSWGIVFAVLSGIIFMWATIPAKLVPTEVIHDNASATNGQSNALPAPADESRNAPATQGHVGGGGTNQ